MPSSQFAKPPPSFSAGSKDDFVPKFGQKGKKAGPPAGKGPLPWDSYFDRKDSIDGKIPIFWAGNSGHIFICLHGAGHSALTFSCLAKELKDKYQVVSFDFRGHGENTQEQETEMSEQNLIEDTIKVVQWVTEKNPDDTVIMVGHSMGGAIASKATEKMMKEKESYPFAKHLHGLFVIDVAEGSALDALPFMEQIVKSRPQEFNTLEELIMWTYQRGDIRNLESARISQPH